MITKLLCRKDFQKSDEDFLLYNQRLRMTQPHPSPKKLTQKEPEVMSLSQSWKANNIIAKTRNS